MLYPIDNQNAINNNKKKKRRKKRRRRIVLVIMLVKTVVVVEFIHTSFQPVLYDLGCGMCYPVCGMVHIKEPWLLIRKSSPCGGIGFPLHPSDPLPYV